MNLSRLGVVVLACLCLLRPAVLRADVDDPPFQQPKQFSATTVVTLPTGGTMSQKIYVDNQKVRLEMNVMGMAIISIARPDEKKAYSVMPAQKTVMVMDIDPDKIKATMGTAMKGKYDLVGPDTVDNQPATKYKVTTMGKTFFYWIDPKTQIPLKMQAEDGSMSIEWKDFHAGPQDPALFEPPADYKVQQMTMPAGMPGGGAPPATDTPPAGGTPPPPSTPSGGG